MIARGFRKRLAESFPNEDPGIVQAIVQIVKAADQNDPQALSVLEEQFAESHSFRARPGHIAERAMDLIDWLIYGSYGVEAVEGTVWVDRYWEETALLYTNTGDSYSPAVTYETRKYRWDVQSWGDYVERHRI